ncbi:helix-turn-helix domain-containing protein [Streptomyces sp. NBC_00648]|uniref:helix-turn-helix domain-containing protein n=1 Tax=Streptomyces sp. NBC_00648 TaxID=2975797 RepID=UPI003249189B
MSAPGANLPFPIPPRAPAAGSGVFPLGALGRAQGHPSALKIIAGGKLRQLREACGLMPKQVCARLDVSLSKINKIEHGHLGCKPDDARAFLALYGVHEPLYVQQFLELVEQSLRPEYWKPWRTTVKGFFAPLLALEGAAQRIRIYEPFYVPGLLQTPAYAAAVIRAEWPNRLEVEVNRIVALRMARQAQFARQHARGEAPDLWVALREEVFEYSVEDRAVLRAQVRQVIERVERGEAAIQVAAPQVMSRVPLTSNVTYLRFGRADLPDAVYVEQVASADFHQDPEQVEQYLVRLDRLATQVRTPEESLRWLKQQHGRL